MTEVTDFRQSVRLFQSYDPVTPSILSSFLLHLSDALPSGRVLLRLSVRQPSADSPTAVQALKVDFHHGFHASPRYRYFIILLFPSLECLRAWYTRAQLAVSSACISACNIFNLLFDNLYLTAFFHNTFGNIRLIWQCIHWLFKNLFQNSPKPPCSCFSF